MSDDDKHKHSEACRTDERKRLYDPACPKCAEFIRIYNSLSWMKK